MLRRRVVSRSKQFGEHFSKAISPSIAETDVTVSIAPRVQKRKNRFAFSGSSEQSFWEELRQSRVSEKVPKVKVKLEMKAVIPEENCIVKRPEEVITESNMEKIAKSPLSRYLEQPDELLQLRPDRLVMQQNLVKAKDATDVLLFVQSSMDAVNVSTALHRIAKLLSKKGSITHVQVVKSDARFIELLEMVESFLESDKTGPVFLSNVFWALVKLDLFPEAVWAPKLVDQLLLSPMSCMELLGSNLYAIAELERKNQMHACNSSLCEKVNELKDRLVMSASNHAVSITNVHALVSICTSLARIKRVDKPLLTALSENVIKNLGSISVDDLTSVLWAFTSLRVTDSILYSKVQQVLEGGKARDCSKRNLVDISWALAKSKSSGASNESMSELFRFTLAPLIRHHLMDYSVRELCTLLWSFASAEIVDFDFFNDVAHALFPKIDQMNAHDVSSVVWALGSVGYMHKEFFNAVKHQALKLKNIFTPLQLTRVIYGLGAGGVRDKHVFTELVCQAKKSMHVLYTQNIVDILIGLQRADFPTSAEEIIPFLKTLNNNTQNLSGRDAVQVLAILGELEKGAKMGISRDLDILEKLESIVSERFNCAGRWIPNGFDLVDLLKALADLDSRNTELTERVILHLSTLYKSPSFTGDLFLKFLNAIAILSETSEAQRRLVAKLLLLKERGIQTAMERLTEQLVGCADSMSPENAVQILDMYARISYADDHIVRFAESLAEAKLSTTEHQIVFLRSLVQLQLLPDIAFALAEKTNLADLAEVDVLLDYVWARLALADDVRYIPVEVFEKIGELYDGVLPKNLFRAKQVAVSCGDLKISPSFDRFLKDMSLFGHSKGKKPKSGAQKLTQFIDKHESYICHSLSHSKIPHSQNEPVLFYSVTASVGPKRCLDLVGVADSVKPTGERWTGEKILRNIHLAQAGWRVTNLRIRDVQKALDCKSLHTLVSDSVSQSLS